ncbi:unnamed protein product [Brassicogethes aeneus]|uniref:G-protein coupled receptors family 1 profile domain-containing protein n=1 Tax=Brassicogethes aeneus TaxID=1431903 RepID=A0A9P0BBV7_BRAAE|nr:unnamed protein product [Brassicogethes aeneus]
MTPLRPRMGRTVTLVLAMSTWVMGVILGIPSLIYYKTYTQPYPDGEERVICYPEWPDGVTNLSMMEYIFRRGFKQFFSWLPFVNLSPEVLTRREVLTSKRRSYSAASPERNRIVRNVAGHGNHSTQHLNLHTTRPPTTSTDTCYMNVNETEVSARRLRSFNHQNP